jgi:hypothetical protein
MQKRQSSNDLSSLSKISKVADDPSSPAHSPIKSAIMASSMPASVTRQREPQFLFSGSQGCVYSSGGFPCTNPELNKVHENDIMKIQNVSSYKEHIVKKY